MNRKMSAIQSALVGGAALVCTCSEVARANLVVNGGFESGLSGWTFSGDGVNDVAGTSSDTPGGIGSSADLDINQGNGLPWLIQDVPVAAGTEYLFTASVREVEPNNPDAWIAAQVWMLASSNSGAILASAFSLFSDPNWTTNSFNITAPPTATIARVLFTPQNPSFGVGTGQYRIDDVSLVVPEGASLAMFASGALLAAAWRRRQRQQHDI